MEDNELNNMNSATGGFMYSAAVIAFIVVSLIFNGIMTLVPQYGYAYWFLNFLPSPIAIAASIALTLKIRKVKFRAVFPVKCRPKYYFIGLLLIFGLFFSLNQINDWFLKLFNVGESEMYVKLNEFIYSLHGGWVALALLVVAVMPAIFEEALFRGVILNASESTLGTVRTVLIVGFAFSLFHGSPEQTVYQFLAGCLFALVAVRSGSILPGIVMHFLNNGVVIVLAASGAVDESGGFMTPTVQIVLMVLGAVALIVGLVLLILDRPTVEKTKFGKRIGFMFENPPVKKCVKGSVKSFFSSGSVAVAVLGILWLFNFATLFIGK